MPDDKQIDGGHQHDDDQRCISEFAEVASLFI